MFYDSSNGTRLSIDVGDSTTATIKDLDPELNYTVFVVAYGGDLPSAASNRINISEGTYMYMHSRIFESGCASTVYIIIITVSTHQV